MASNQETKFNNTIDTENIMDIDYIKDTEESVEDLAKGLVKLSLKRQRACSNRRYRLIDEGYQPHHTHFPPFTPIKLDSNITIEYIDMLVDQEEDNYSPLFASPTDYASYTKYNMYYTFDHYAYEKDQIIAFMKERHFILTNKTNAHTNENNSINDDCSKYVVNHPVNESAMAN